MPLEIVTSLKQLDGNATIDNVITHFMEIDPSITIKKFNPDGNIILVHNDFKSNNTSNIYNECRSLVVKVENYCAKIISYSHETIQSKEMDKFEFMEGDKFEESFEGTLVSIFYHDGKWYFITPRCTDIDSSHFHSHEVSFGKMFDDCLKKMDLDRESFTKELNKEHCYSFVIVHHLNKYIYDYTEQYGPEYAKLVFVIEREINNYCHINDTFPDIPSLIYPREFFTLDKAKEHLNNEQYFLCKRYDEERSTYQYFKIQTPEYIKICRRKPNYNNVWYCYLQIYLNNEPDFTVNDYRIVNNIETQYKVNNRNTDITGMIYLLYKETAKVLMDMVLHFTEFDYEKQSFTKINTMDYEVMDDMKYNIIKKQIATLQNLVRLNKITDSTGIISHLRKFVTVTQFVNILRGLDSLKIMTFCKFDNKYYESYVTLLLSELKIN